MKKIFFIFFVGAWIGASVEAQLFLSDFSPHRIDFDLWGGEGLVPAPKPGQLDSQQWKVQGLSDGNSLFGESYIQGDFARGTSPGGVTQGGLYAFEAGSATLLGIQPTGTDMTPGCLVLWIQNQSKHPWSGWSLSFDQWVFNDENRSSALNFGFALSEPLDPGNQGTVIHSFTTPEQADAFPQWERTPSPFLTVNQSLAPGENLFLIWSTQDFSGSGSRDELGLGPILFQAIPEPTTTTMLWMGFLLWIILAQRAKTTS